MFHADFLQCFAVIFLSLSFYTTCNSSLLTAQIQAADVDGTKSVMPKFVSCMYNETMPMLELIPNPYDCQSFFTCHNKGGMDPEHTLVDCQNGVQGKPLHYNFLKCYCEEPEKATCYDQNNVEHRKDMYKCARPLHS